MNVAFAGEKRWAPESMKRNLTGRDFFYLIRYGTIFTYDLPNPTTSALHRLRIWFTGSMMGSKRKSKN